MESWKVAQATGQLRQTPVKKVLFNNYGFTTKPRMSGLPDISKADVDWQKGFRKKDDEKEQKSGNKGARFRSSCEVQHKGKRKSQRQV